MQIFLDVQVRQRAKHVIEDMNGIIDMIIEHDEVDIGVESTIIDLSVDKPVILRPGYITKAQLEQVLGEVFVDPAIQGNIADGVIPKAPGMKYKHYAPKAKVIIVDGKDNDVIDVINCLTKDKQLEGLKVGIMTCSENMKKYKADVVFDIGSRYDEASNARTLFEALRLFDEKKVDYVYSESFPTNNVGAAVMNRLIKAVWTYNFTCIIYDDRMVELFMNTYNKIIFVCTGNTCRSPMAATIMQHNLMGIDISVESREWWCFFQNPIILKQLLFAASHGMIMPSNNAKQIENSDFGKDTLVLVMDSLMKTKLYNNYDKAINVYTINEFIGCDNVEVR